MGRPLLEFLLESVLVGIFEEVSFRRLVFLMDLFGL